jgi:hypothetical protein
VKRMSVCAVLSPIQTYKAGFPLANFVPRSEIALYRDKIYQPFATARKGVRMNHMDFEIAIH